MLFLLLSVVAVVVELDGWVSGGGDGGAGGCHLLVVVGWVVVVVVVGDGEEGLRVVGWLWRFVSHT